MRYGAGWLCGCESEFFFFFCALENRSALFHFGLRSTIVSFQLIFWWIWICYIVYPGQVFSSSILLVGSCVHKYSLKKCQFRPLQRYKSRHCEYDIVKREYFMSQQTKLKSKHITKLPFLSLSNLQNLLPLLFLWFSFFRLCSYNVYSNCNCNNDNIIFPIIYYRNHS